MIRKRHWKILVAAGAIAFALSAGAQAADVSVVFSFETFTSELTPPNSPPMQALLDSELHGVQDITSAVSTTPFSISGPFGESISYSFDGNTANTYMFTPAPATNVVVGQEFRLGTFYLTDGIWFGDADATFEIRTVSTDPALDNVMFTDTLRMVLNPFDPDPRTSADIYYLVNERAAAPDCLVYDVVDPDLIACHSLRIYELFDSPILPRVDGISNAGTIEIWGMIDGLELTDYENPTGGLFLSPSFTQDPNAGPGSAPEPPMLLLFGAALVGLTIARALPEGPSPTRSTEWFRARRSPGRYSIRRALSASTNCQGSFKTPLRNAVTSAVAFAVAPGS